MDYNKLKTFTIVAQVGSISKAARILFRTQPAITQQIQQLEEEIGISLLHRKSGKVFLTPAGEKIYHLADQKLGNIDQFLEQFHKDSLTHTGHIKFGVIPEYGNRILTQKLGKFRKLYPHVDLTVSYAPSEIIEQKLITNEITLGILARVENPGLFQISKYSSESFYLLASPKYLQKKGKPNQYQQIINFELIDFREDFSLLAPWLKINSESAYKKLKKESPHLIIQSYEGIKRLVLDGLGLAVLPSYLVKEELQKKKLIRLFENSKKVESPLYLVKKEQRLENKLETLFTDFLKN
ncbi:MAG: LysR family transcriptional regulator [Bacteriovoracaceae bacterium]|jgi:DNA-binding transcriptional LysR family regulator|nr:LysR family transcriptional regulator [Bacteriovoracaceae bacterium]